MKLCVYSTRSYDRDYLGRANITAGHELEFLETPLNLDTATLAQGSTGVCCFVDDDLRAEVLERLAALGVRLIALRATGFNNVDLAHADALGLTVMRVSHYSPHSVAEFAVGLMLSLNRRIHKAYARVREGNFLLDGLLGFDMHGKTVAVIGTGKIGAATARILLGFGCRVLATDQQPDPALVELGCAYVPLEQALGEADIVTLHVPLTPQTHHLIDAAALAHMRPGSTLINTSRGALVDATALIGALKARHLGAVGLDVYEEESHLYFQNLSDEIIDDDIFMRLLGFPNVLITGHQAFFTHEAMTTIAETTLRNVEDFAAGRRNENTLGAARVVAAAG